MRIEGTLTENDYGKALWLHIRPRKIFAVIGLFLIAVAILVAIAGKSIEIIIMILIILFLLFIVIPFIGKYNFRKFKALSERTSVTIQEEKGLFFKRQNGEGLVPWSEIYKWKYSKDIILLYPAPNIFYMLPMSFFENENEYYSFIKFLKEKIEYHI